MKDEGMLRRVDERRGSGNREMKRKQRTWNLKGDLLLIL